MVTFAAKAPELSVLKPLTKALADGDPIYAVIRGSAVNQDGRSNGLMAPNPRAQEAVLREAYREPRSRPAMFNTSRPMARVHSWAIRSRRKPWARFFALTVLPGNFALVGSVKTNIGHLEAAAGIAGLIKVALALKHREIPPSLNFEEPNPHIPFEQLQLRVQTNLEPWPAEPAPALAGVSSFGFGGTNAHVVLQEAPMVRLSRTPNAGCDKGNPPSEICNTNPTYLLPLSARSPEALRSLARDYQDLLISHGVHGGAARRLL